MPGLQPQQGLSVLILYAIDAGHYGATLGVNLTALRRNAANSTRPPDREHVDGTHKVGVGVMQGSRERHKMDPSAIGPLRHGAHTPDFPVLADRDRHRTAVMRQRSTIGGINVPRPAPAVSSQHRAPSHKATAALL